jgi:hypothetical protein
LFTKFRCAESELNYRIYPDCIKAHLLAEEFCFRFNRKGARKSKGHKELIVYKVFDALNRNSITGFIPTEFKLIWSLSNFVFALTAKAQGRAKGARV